MKHFLFCAFCAVSCASVAQSPVFTPAAMVDFDAYERLIKEVKPYRAARLVSLDEFLQMAQEPNTVILDTRSAKMYDGRRIKGAVHLNFSDFTQSNLDRLIPDPNTRILIYCNNNFRDDSHFFASKVSTPKTVAFAQDKPVSLALNIPTFVNLYGYGYRNVYELGEEVSVQDVRLEWDSHTLDQPRTLNLEDFRWGQTHSAPVSLPRIRVNPSTGLMED